MRTKIRNNGRYFGQADERLFGLDVAYIENPALKGKRVYQVRY